MLRVNSLHNYFVQYSSQLSYYENYKLLFYTLILLSCFVVYLLGMQGLEAFCHSDPQAESLHVVATTEANLYQGD